MSAQDRTENVLRDIHVLFSKAEAFEDSKTKVIIDKSEMMDLLKELNACMYDIMEEHEMTVQSREAAIRRAKKENDEQIFEARKNAEDIYAASIMYSDRALRELRRVIGEAREEINEISRSLDKRFKDEMRTVKDNQYELKSQLQDLIDTEKYIHLIEEENKKIEKLKEEQREDEERLGEIPDKNFADVVPEIRINEDYFRAKGLDIPGQKEEEEDAVAEKLEEAQAMLSADLDAEYFNWKEEEKEEQKKGFSFFRKKKDKEED